MADEKTIRKLVITPEQREFSTIESDDKFTVRMPLPFERAHIIALTARAIGGVDIKSIPDEEYEFIRLVITLNQCVVSAPDWWKGADQCPDTELLYKLWRFFGECEKQFSDSLKRPAGIKSVG